MEKTVLFDASKEPLGRMAAKIAHLLMGKHRPSFARNDGGGTRIAVSHADRVVLTGRKWNQKRYYRHSGYLGNLREYSAAWMRTHDSRQLVRHAVHGMLPKNRTRQRRMRQLAIYRGEAPASALR